MELLQLSEYAILARETYTADSEDAVLLLPLGWNLKPEVTFDSHGNCFCVFINYVKREIILSVKGTSNLENIETNVNLFLSRILHNNFIPPGQNTLEDLAKELLESDEVAIKKYHFKIIGHSLGGMMAELCAVKLGIHCISFESPGSMCILQHHAETYPGKNYHLIDSYLSAPNCINCLDGHPGNIFRMYLPEHPAIDRGLAMTHQKPRYKTAILNLYQKCYNNACYYAKKSRNYLTKLWNKLTGVKQTIKSAIIIDDINWLLQQHSIANIADFLANSGHVSLVDSWPISPWSELADQLQDYINQEHGQACSTDNTSSAANIIGQDFQDKRILFSKNSRYIIHDNATTISSANAASSVIHRGQHKKTLKIS